MIASFVDLERFITAQDQPRSGFDSALAEVQRASKQGHWIWYIFPQLSGLGLSSLSKTYGIKGISEAVEYLRDPRLRLRLLEITTAVAERTRIGVSLETLMGSSIDVRKLVSSLTLFGNLARRLQTEDEFHHSLARVADEVLAVAESEGYPPCSYTLEQLARYWPSS
ncbi:MAG TPA: DUF1810 family protein [Vicinamibacterales bacterium]|jgi:uncharacterized protein (DUF1810 family)|nr:DUF1810 family protein [Vicinamibacterales bacterium]